MDKNAVKRSIILIGIIIGVLMVMLAIGFTIGFLSGDPDGLERSLIDARGEDWVEGLASPWEPIFGWIGNDYIVALLGISITVLLIIVFFELISYGTKKERQSD